MVGFLKNIITVLLDVKIQIWSKCDIKVNHRSWFVVCFYSEEMRILTKNICNKIFRKRKIGP